MQPEAIALYESSGYVSIPPFGYYRDSGVNRCFGKLLVLTACPADTPMPE